MKRPEVSFLIVTHNAGAWLSPCLRSAFAQTLADVEVVLVDNASTDGSVEAAAREFRDRRLKIIVAEDNLGPYAGAERGWAHCEGRWIARMDADDWSLPERIARQRELLLRRPELALVGCDAILLDPQNRPLGVALALRSDKLRRRASAFEIAVPHPTALFRREALEEAFYNPSLFSCGDLELIEWFARQGRAGRVPEVLYVYRQHGASITASRAGLQLLSACTVRRKILAAPDDDARRALRAESFAALREDPRQQEARGALLRAFAEEARAAGEPVAHVYFTSQVSPVFAWLAALGWCLRRPRLIGTMGILMFMRSGYPLWKRYRQRRVVRSWSANLK